jgi:diadenosine tetraphosphate (Ap4A) HIT family hydrolase
LPFGGLLVTLRNLRRFVAMTKQNPNRPAQTLIIAFGDFNKKEKEPPPSWEDLVAFANSIEHECPC